MPDWRGEAHARANAAPKSEGNTHASSARRAARGERLRGIKVAFIAFAFHEQKCPLKGEKSKEKMGWSFVEVTGRDTTTQRTHPRAPWRLRRRPRGPRAAAPT
jgi:hypothetical protein